MTRLFTPRPFDWARDPDLNDESVVDAFIRQLAERDDERSALIDAHHVLTSEHK